ncbi:methyltransferase [Nocardia nova]|uniref:Methyltransferase n=1 Tax=Nocardia nova TaxID=37330 RepID=A0A2S6AMF0_9NOCA|nr:thymidylate synthase [Nocardia nova]PPJ36400.1 methyltransferase [Nocardia nova]
MISVTADSANELFASACRQLLRSGATVSPRGMATTEVVGAHLHLRNPRRRLVDLPPVRLLNPAFAVAETMWILSGSDDPWIFKFNRNLAQYTDDGRLQGAYGPRMRRWHGRIDQLDRVRDLLTRDRDSRQAVIQLFDPARDTRGHRDVPCTLNYRFFIRDDRLHMHTTMRSQDLWLGFGYDIFATTILQELLAGWLGVELGEYHHFVDSLHLYDKHIGRADEIPCAPEPSALMAPISVAWDEFDTVLASTIEGRDPGADCSMWANFAEVMSSYSRWCGGERGRAREQAAQVPGELGEALQRWLDYLAARSETAGAIA